ncbi:exonuclease SbcCD subunit D [Faecalimonas hominis]
MKFIHLSDLHIGKRVNEFSMIEDQKYILRQVIELVQKERPDGVLLAGDIYDKPVPSAEAVQVFDEFLNGLAEQKVSIFIISGNHDSPERLAFGGNLLKNTGVYVSPVFREIPKAIAMYDEYGEVNVYLLPFIKPAYVKQVMPKENVETYQEAVQTIIEHMEIDNEKRNIILAHQFVTGAARCDSEEVSVGGLDNIDASVFAPFDYVALGHIHGRQSISREEVRYCGTLLKYSFSESRQKKTVTIVEMKEKGNVAIREISLSPKHDMREIKGTYGEVTAREFYQGSATDDYLHITLTDEEDILDAINRLRVIYPNIMKMDYDNTRTRNKQCVGEIEQVEKKTPSELFGELYLLQNNQEMSEEQNVFLKNLIEKIWEE